MFAQSKCDENDFIADVIQWDILNWSQSLSFWEPDLLAYNPKHSRVLALGERNGGLSLWFAIRGYQVICSDLHPFRKPTYELHERYGVSDRISYVNLSAFEIPFADESIDIVACKSVIGGLKLVYGAKETRNLENQALALKEVHRVLKEGGCWVGAENMRGTVLHRELRRVIKKGEVNWRHLTVEEWPRLLQPFRSLKVKYFGILPTVFSSRLVNRFNFEVNRRLSPKVPAAWNYIAFIEAFK